MIRRSIGRLVLLTGALLIAGCNPPDPADVLGDSQESTGSQSERSCRDNLANALSSLAPDRLDISSDVESTVDVLNRWLTDCGSPEKLTPEQLKQIERYASPEMQANLVRGGFTQRDAGFIRNAILCHQIVEQSTLAAKNDLERTLKLFQFVIRNVVLTPDTQALPLTLYEILLFGRGSEEQQAWLFAELLRQLRIDSALLETKAAEGDKPNWLFAVFLDEGTYLFDFQLQTPVPADPGSQNIEGFTPATLSQAFENPAVLDSLRELGSHVPTAEALKTVDIRLLAESTHWSPRMKALNTQLVGENFLIFDGLLDHEGGEGELSRIKSFVGQYWEEPRLSVSDLPDRQTRQFWAIEGNSSQAQALAVRRDPFNAPIEIQSNERTGETRQIPTRDQWSARLAQLQGKFSDAVRNYGLIRLDERKKSSRFGPEEANNPAVQLFLQTHQSAAQDAHFWVAVSQLDLEEFEEASDSFADYHKGAAQGRWSDAVPYLWGKNFLRLGNAEKARELLEPIGESSQFYLPARYLLNELQKSKGEKPDHVKPGTGEPKQENPVPPTEDKTESKSPE